jgi:hypothetical protein
MTQTLSTVVELHDLNNIFYADLSAWQHARLFLGEAAKQPGRDCPACPGPREQHGEWGNPQTGCALSIALITPTRRPR